MKIAAIIFTILFGFAVTVYVAADMLKEIVNHTICQKEKTSISCHYYEAEP